MYPLILGTHNRKKGLELAELLAPFGFALQTLADVPDPLVVDETGNSFGENAALKAVQQARHLGAWVLGEDSGLCVDPLDGRPGIYSARYAGVDATDERNNAFLLEELAGVADERRTAFYVCHVALADPRGAVRANCEATCGGRIRRKLSGAAGFGYDPLFEIVEYHRTFAELGPHVKRVLSHRARAMRRIVPQILTLARRGDWEFPATASEGKAACPESMP